MPLPVLTKRGMSMDASTILGAINAGFLVAIYLYIQAREDKTRSKAEALEKRVHEVETNYNAKFAAVHDKIHETELVILEKMGELEGNIRESNHNLQDSVTKALHEIEAKIKAA